MVQGCTRTKQTFWTEDQFVLIMDHDTRVVEIVTRDLEKAKPGKWGCVQARELWSPKEEAHVRPGHFWLLKLGKVDARNSCVEKEFKLGPRKSEEYIRASVLGTVTVPSWLTCGCIEWMRMTQV